MPKDSQQWLAMFKIALVETNTEMLAMLIEEIPVFQSAKEAESARILSQQAIARLQTLREQTRDSMQQIRKNLQFLHATEHSHSGSLDITS